MEPGPTDTGPWREIQTLFHDIEQGLSLRHRELCAPHVRGLLKLVGTLQSRPCRRTSWRASSRRR